MIYISIFSNMYALRYISMMIELALYSDRRNVHCTKTYYVWGQNHFECAHHWHEIKFSFPEKATKVCAICLMVLKQTLLSQRQDHKADCPNFVAFWEKLNFNEIFFLPHAFKVRMKKKTVEEIHEILQIIEKNWMRLHEGFNPIWVHLVPL